MEESSGQWDGPYTQVEGSGAFRRKMREEVQIKQRKRLLYFEDSSYLLCTARCWLEGAYQTRLHCQPKVKRSKN